MRAAPSLPRLMEAFRLTREEAEHLRACLHAGKMARVDLPGFYGVETVLSADQSRVLFYYLNTGDTYSPTVCRYAGSSRYIISTWGDCVEALERRGVRSY